MPVYFDKSKQRWRFTFNRVVEHQRRRSSKLLPAGWSRAQADKYDRETTSRLYALATGVEQQILMVGSAVRAYVDHRVPDLKDGLKAKQELARLVPWYQGKPLAALAQIAAEYTKASRGTLAPATIRNRLAYLKAAVRYAFRKHGVGDQDYSARMMLPTVRNERQVYARAPELAKLWGAFDDAEARALFRLAYYCGVRWRSEILPRVPEDIQRTDEDVWLLVGTTKNGLPRMSWVHPDARRDLKRLPFTGSDQRYYAAYKRARIAAGMEQADASKNLRPHDLRHSLASQIISTGGTLLEVQAALHHESVISSKRYSHLYPERVKLAIQRATKMPTVRRRNSRKKAA